MYEYNIDNMSDMFETVFGPLSQQYCLYFYYLSILGFVLFALVILSALSIGISKRKDFSFYLTAFMGSLGYLIFYFQNRLLYSMCQKTL